MVFKSLQVGFHALFLDEKIFTLHNVFLGDVIFNSL